MLERIKGLCTQNNLTIGELEKKLNFGNGTVRKWDNSQPSIDNVMKVANYFNVSIDYLAGNGDVPARETVEFVKEFEQLNQTQKNLAKLYISLIKNGQAV